MESMDQGEMAKGINPIQKSTGWRCLALFQALLGSGFTA